MDDRAHMGRALELARRGLGLASPNPAVGALVVADGRVVGEGWHEGPGTPHAEVVALRAAGVRARGATLYSTLEPCDHHGRTPPCTGAIVAAGVARVVVAMRDPNPIVDGRGLRALREAGISVDLGVREPEARRLTEAYAKHVATGLPFVTLKLAETLDGKVAARDGSSRWITGEEARADAHRLRATVDAIAVGAGTALSDDPALTVRDPAYRGPAKLRVLVDARGRVPPRGRLFDGSAPTLVATTEAAPRGAREAWREVGADVAVLPGEAGGVSLPALLEHLGKRDVQHLLLEGGPTLAFSAVAAGCVDRVVLYLAPRLLGGIDAPGALGGAGFAPVGEAVELAIRSVERVGGDLKVEADVHRDR
ncbi:MAG TPA: bifunctional diaminohydroxyphosphoribosylaminopyrimidine deaminase/5-amino-6-(5-phosphoribosylamino)uracil reductase RibD [Actinomycetota bacterium]|nr:bifunctional diaminohydroxyphosphoribosylaminopyrimidine deaminase/5-amino-6-(5-phosphoribosylamino)uracil reductase RibD [Actinomycetota bacterium]